METPLTLGNLLSGLAGALIGLVGAFGLQWWERSRRKGASLRATLMEVAANGAALSVTRASGVYVPLAVSTWQSEVGWLAQALSPGEFVTVATFYMRVEAIRGAGYLAGGPPDPTLVGVANEALERGDKAASILETRGWSRRDQARIKAALNKLRGKGRSGSP